MKAMWVLLSFMLVLLLLAAAPSWARADPCVPDCVGKVCGTDGCGGYCGYCGGIPAGGCVDGTCQADCFEVTSIGCCSEATMVAKCGPYGLFDTYCQNGKVCGWNFPLGYGCVDEPTEDPSGEWPRECDFSCTGFCEGKECGSDSCGGACGECPPGSACMPSGQCCVPDCTGKECGTDGCLGYCGVCPNNKQLACESGLCVDMWGCWTTSVAGCPGCACEECVCDGDPSCCTQSWHLDCMWYCENICGGCKPCEPDCADAECGDDGCDGSCGECPEGYHCDLNHTCCEKQCSGAECGPDGCGGSCGSCESGAFCDEGTCKQAYGCQPTDNPGCGNCECQACVGELMQSCLNQKWSQECVDLCNDQCGGCGPDCSLTCDGKQCGPDDCGGSCGICPPGWECTDNGFCCQPDCEGVECGTDGCQGSCGTCPDGSYCVEGTCIEETPRPSDAIGGVDGRGGRADLPIGRGTDAAWQGGGPGADLSAGGQGTSPPGQSSSGCSMVPYRPGKSSQPGPTFLVLAMIIATLRINRRRS